MTFGFFSVSEDNDKSCNGFGNLQAMVEEKTSHACTRIAIRGDPQLIANVTQVALSTLSSQ